MFLASGTKILDFCHHSQSEVGTQLYETLGLEGEIGLAIRKLKEWAAPRAVEKNLLTLSDTVYIQPEPLGVVLIIGAWNYPWAVTIQPLIGAIAAGTVLMQQVCVMGLRAVCVCVCTSFFVRVTLAVVLCPFAATFDLN